jgi:photosystem II stability/assembly factor-like uncharacterized protein
LEGKIVETTDGGKSWKFIAEDVSAFSTDPLYALSLHDGNGWISGGAGRVLQLQGDAWKPASLGLPVVPWLRSVDFLDENSGWIVGGYGTIIHTTDGGKTWRMSVG